MTHDEIRHFNVLFEDIKSKVQLVLEGHAILDRKIESTRQDLKDTILQVHQEVKWTNERIDETNERIDKTNQQLQELSKEIKHVLSNHEERLTHLETA